MAIAYTCDGCGETLPRGEASKRGTLGPTYYCRACVATVDAALADVDRVRVRFVKAFETYRATRLGEARKMVRSLPDE